MTEITALFDGIAEKPAAQKDDPASNERRYLIPVTEAARAQREILLKLDLMDASAGEDGYYVIPYARASFLVNFREREDMEYVSTENIMPIVGMKRCDKLELVVFEGMKYDFELKVCVTGGRYSLSARYDLSRINIYEDIRLRVITLEGAEADYSGMARAYRHIQEEKLRLVPLAERIKTDPVLAYGCKDMPVIRIRLGWKPVPSPVLEQTLETEPEMRVACTFAQVEELMEEMRRQGIEKAELCLVGWNRKGHDGRWPQMLPVEPELGGEEGLRRLIDHADRIGYRICCHTNGSDTYRISEFWDENEVIRKKNGDMSVNAQAWSGGRMYDLCPKVADEKYLAMNLPKVQALGFRGFHYIDVLASVPPRTCHHPEHPVNADQCACHWNHMLQSFREAVGGSASEGGFDFAIKSLDYALYIAFNIIDGMPKAADEVIPLWQLVYHGYVLSNPSAETVNFFVKGAKNRLRFYEFGGIPTLYYFSRFVDTDGANWMGDLDITCASEQARENSVRQMKAMLDEYRPFAERALAHMDAHRKLAEGVYETVYSDGYHVIVNYSDADHVTANGTVRAKDLLLFYAG